jgi:hypothetical protein
MSSFVASRAETALTSLGSARFDPAPFKERLRSIAAARTAALADAEVAKTLDDFEGNIP